MQKYKKLFLLSIVGLLAACESASTNISFYAGDQIDKHGEMQFNYDLFYRNDPKVGGPDPFVFNNTERDGYFYIFSTVGLYYVGRSKDCMEWEGLGSALPKVIGTSNSLMKSVLNGNYWAPEIVYDEDEEKYYMFASANSVDAGTTYKCNSFVGISDNPGGPYYIVNFKNTNPTPNEQYGFIGAPEEARHTFRDSVYTETFSDYVFLEPGKVNEAMQNTVLGATAATTKYLNTIDFHPFIDPVTKDKFLFFESVQNGTFCIFGMKMSTWLIPDWSTFDVLTIAGAYTIDEYVAGNPETPSYETNNVNEGPAVIYHNSKYYMSISNGNYNDSTYALIQAVSDSPLGPWRKLREEENGLFMSSQLEGNEDVSSSGHNSFVTIGEEIYNIYHKHKSFVIGGPDRVAAIDKLKWITIKDIYGHDLDVMYMNGPTSTIQPRISEYSDYKNIAPDGKISLAKGTLAEGSSLKYLNDDFLSLYKIENDVTAMIKETELTSTSTIKVNFDVPQTVRAVLAYNSKREFNIFKEITKVEIEYDYEGSKGMAVMDNVPFNKAFYKELKEFDEIIYVTPGAHAFAEFNEIKGVKSVSFTFNVGSGKTIGISELVILGDKLL